MAIGYWIKDEPFVQIGLTGARDQQLQPLNCLIDTGFTGFILVPEAGADVFKLDPQTTLPVDYAGGSSANLPVRLGIAEIDGVQRKGIVALEPGGKHVLLGIRFLRIFGLRIVVDPINDLVELSNA